VNSGVHRTKEYIFRSLHESIGTINPRNHSVNSGVSSIKDLITFVYI
jgi:hypothetical protein